MKMGVVNIYLEGSCFFNVDRYASENAEQGENMKQENNSSPLARKEKWFEFEKKSISTTDAPGPDVSFFRRTRTLRHEGWW
jgi:hypothetical protein